MQKKNWIKNRTSFKSNHGYWETHVCRFLDEMQLVLPIVLTIERKLLPPSLPPSVLPPECFFSSQTSWDTILRGVRQSFWDGGSRYEHPRRRNPIHFKHMSSQHSLARSSILTKPPRTNQNLGRGGVVVLRKRSIHLIRTPLP